MTNYRDKGNKGKPDTIYSPDPLFISSTSLNDDKIESILGSNENIYGAQVGLTYYRNIFILIIILIIIQAILS